VTFVNDGTIGGMIGGNVVEIERRWKGWREEEAMEQSRFVEFHGSCRVFNANQGTSIL
jgi:hypothetical protein